MENFIVSARKYRPAIFESVVGQSAITTTLKNSIKNKHLAQAYLFCGPRGVGKTTCARIFAKTINCFNVTDKIEACDECEWPWINLWFDFEVHSHNFKRPGEVSSENIDFESMKEWSIEDLYNELEDTIQELVSFAEESDKSNEFRNPGKVSYGEKEVTK